MENEKNTTENNQNDSEMKSKSEGGRTAVIVAVALMAGIFSGSAIYRIRANDVKTAEVDNQVTTTAITSEPVSETEKVTEEETTAVTTATEPAQTTAEVTTEATTTVTSLVTTDVSEMNDTEEKIKVSPLANKNSQNYPYILSVLPKIETFNRIFEPYHGPATQNLAKDREYKDIEVAADETYSYGAIISIEKDLNENSKRLSDFEKLYHIKRYYKPTEEYNFKTEAEVRAELSEFVTDRFIDSHYISAYEDVPGRYTLYKTINGELYQTFADDRQLGICSWGIINNFDGKSCDVTTYNIMPDTHLDRLNVRFALDDGIWKIDGYEHVYNTGKERKYSPEAVEISKNAISEFRDMEKVVLGIGVETDEKDEHVECINNEDVVYLRVTDDRFSNVSEIENFICSHSIGDLRMRCISYIRGEGDNSIPVYMMSEGALYCSMPEGAVDFSYKDYYNEYEVISFDDNYIHCGLKDSVRTHNSLFLKNTEDGWKIYDMD